MIDNNSVKKTVIGTFNKLVSIGGNKKCIIKRYIKNQKQIFSDKLNHGMIKNDITSIDGTFDCFFIAQPSLIINGNVDFGSEYNNKIFIKIDDVKTSQLKSIMENDEVYIEIGGENKKYIIKSISILFDVIYIILLN